MKFLRGRRLACPYFIPREIVNDGSWPYPSRLPLGAGWSGTCGAGEENVEPAPAQIREFCNLGYASACPRIPRSRDWDAVRFSIAGSNAEQMTLRYACELGHAPAAHGTLTYDIQTGTCFDGHCDERIRRLAASYFLAYRVRCSGCCDPENL